MTAGWRTGEWDLDDDERVPAGLRATRLTVGDEDLIVVSFPRPAPPSGMLDNLAPGPREVATLALLGLGNTEIAARRGTSPTTVAKQLGAAYRALGVSGRRELAAFVRRM
jgi:DNA-binding NarL/FixJ family response regulator